MATKDTHQDTTTAEPVPLEAAPTIEAAFARFLVEGDHPEVAEFENRLGPLLAAPGHPRNVWDFIEDAVEGTGGFANGMYIYPFRLELEGEVIGQVSEKYRERQRIAAYDGFAGDICADPWNLIVSKADMVKRSVNGDTAAEAWLQNVDGNGTTLMDFMEEPFRQGQKFGVGYFGVDRPEALLLSMADDLDPANEPYPYVIPTRNVRNWLYDERGDFLELMILEPACAEKAGHSVLPVRVWSRDGWAIFRPIDGRDQKTRAGWTIYQVSGPLALGRIPVVRLPNERPEAGKSGLGRTPMVKIARLSQEVYNMDSEAREVERKAAAPIFVIPVKDAKAYTSGPAISYGMDDAVAYDGDAGAPAWVQPSLEVLERYDDRRGKKITASYRMANLAPLGTSVATGVTKTESGYHAEMEFSKTERRITRLAGNAANAEREAVTLYRQWKRGLRREEARKGVEVSYPREFGVRDLDKALNRVMLELETVQSEEVVAAVLEEWFRQRFPRKKPEEIDSMVAAEVKKRASMRAQMDAMAKKAASSAAGAKAGAFAKPQPGGAAARAEQQE